VVPMPPETPKPPMAEPPKPPDMCTDPVTGIRVPCP
jgi:hypothetical protein